MINDAAQKKKKNNILGDEVVRHNLLLVIDLLKLETKVSLLTLWWIPYKHIYI